MNDAKPSGTGTGGGGSFYVIIVILIILIIFATSYLLNWTCPVGFGKSCSGSSTPDAPVDTPSTSVSQSASTGQSTSAYVSPSTSVSQSASTGQSTSAYVSPSTSFASFSATPSTSVSESASFSSFSATPSTSVSQSASVSRSANPGAACGTNSDCYGGTVCAGGLCTAVTNCTGGYTLSTPGACPTTCGYPGGTVTDTYSWVTTTQATGGGFCVNEGTTSSSPKSCPSTSACGPSCVGSWVLPSCSACGTNYGPRPWVYKVTNPASGGGAACPFADGATQASGLTCGNTPPCYGSTSLPSCYGGYGAPVTTACPDSLGGSQTTTQTWNKLTQGVDAGGNALPVLDACITPPPITSTTACPTTVTSCPVDCNAVYNDVMNSVRANSSFPVTFGTSIITQNFNRCFYTHNMICASTPCTVANPTFPTTSELRYSDYSCAKTSQFIFNSSVSTAPVTSSKSQLMCGTIPNSYWSSGSCTVCGVNDRQINGSCVSLPSGKYWTTTSGSSSTPFTTCTPDSLGTKGLSGGTTGNYNTAGTNGTCVYTACNGGRIQAVNGVCPACSLGTNQYWSGTTGCGVLTKPSCPAVQYGMNYSLNGFSTGTATTAGSAGTCDPVSCVNDGTRRNPFNANGSGCTACTDPMGPGTGLPWTDSSYTKQDPRYYTGATGCTWAWAGSGGPALNGQCNYANWNADGTRRIAGSPIQTLQGYSMGTPTTAGSRGTCVPV